jgi:hypothetical protein
MLGTAQASKKGLAAKGTPLPHDRARAQATPGARARPVAPFGHGLEVLARRPSAVPARVHTSFKAMRPSNAPFERYDE